MLSGTRILPCFRLPSSYNESTHFQICPPSKCSNLASYKCNYECDTKQSPCSEGSSTKKQQCRGMSEERERTNRRQTRQTNSESQTRHSRMRTFGQRHTQTTHRRANILSGLQPCSRLQPACKSNPWGTSGSGRKRFKANGGVKDKCRRYGNQPLIS